MRCYGFIFNPRSGGGHRAGLLQALMDRLQLQGHGVRLYLCEDDPAKAAEAAVRDGCDVIVACGGDGTVNAAAAALHAAAGDSEAVLGVLPLGTLNHFAKDLGIHNLAEAERVLAAGEARAIDAGLVNGRLFVNNSGIGIYPIMVREREKVRKAGIPKWPAFVVACARTVLRMPFQRLRIEADGRFMANSTPFLFLGNNVYALEGMSFGSRCRLDQGVLGVYMARHVGPTGLFRLAVRALLGTIRQDRDFIAFTATNLIVNKRRRFHVSLDGEVLRMQGPLEYSVLPGAMRVLAPAGAK